MRMRLFILVTLALIGLGLSGCLMGGGEPLEVRPAPWEDGELSRYDLLAPQGNLVAAATWTWKAMPEGWQLDYELSLAQRTDTQSVLMDYGLMPLETEWVSGEKVVLVRYEPETVFFTVLQGGEETAAKSVRRPADAWDNSQTLQSQRALPLAEGYATRYANVIPSTQAIIPTDVLVEGREEVEVPAGIFEAWKVKMSSGGRSHFAWYSAEPPHLLVKYHNTGAGTQFLLRSWRESETAPWQGDSTIPEIPAPRPAEALQPNWLFVALAFLVQYPLMILLPILLGIWLRRKLGVPLKIFLIGGLTFIASQVVHLPLNWAIGLLTGDRGVALWPLPAVALVAGLSSGVCEEVARWLILRFWLKRERGWAIGVQFGAGHGATEAIIFGVLAGMGLLSMLAVTLFSPSILGIPPAQAGATLDAARVYWQSEAYMPLLAGLERVFVIPVHIALAVLVMRSLTRRNLGYLAAAIFGHTALNFWAVWAGAQLHVFWVEAGLAVFGLLALLLIIRLREPRSATYER